MGTTGPLEKILRGPAGLDDGTQNLLGCIRTSMGTLGARTLREMQQVEVVVAPSLLTEGKVYQKAQQLGMGIYNRIYLSQPGSEWSRALAWARAASASHSSHHPARRVRAFVLHNRSTRR